MSYRDDRQALALQISALERENEKLRDDLEDSEARYRHACTMGHEERKRGTRDLCGLCGGSLLPVAVFAGHDMRSPLPLSMSTLRFGAPEGGFTHAAPVRAYACSSCGHLEHFIDMDQAGWRATAEAAGSATVAPEGSVVQGDVPVASSSTDSVHAPVEETLRDGRMRTEE